MESYNVGTWRGQEHNPRSQTTSQEEDTKHLTRFGKIVYVLGVEERVQLMINTQLRRLKRFFQELTQLDTQQRVTTLLYIAKREAKDHNEFSSQQLQNSTVGRLENHNGFGLHQL